MTIIGSTVFLPRSELHLCIFQLCWSGWGESKAGPSYSEQRLGKLNIYSLLSSVEALLALARASLRDRVMQTK